MDDERLFEILMRVMGVHSHCKDPALTPTEDDTLMVKQRFKVFDVKGDAWEGVQLLQAL